VRKDGKVAVGGDGQVTVGQTVMKRNAVKVRRVGGDKILGDSPGDGRRLHLFESSKPGSEQYREPRQGGRGTRQGMADRQTLRQLERFSSSDREHARHLGTGDVIEPEEGVAAIGSGGPYAQAAALALLKHAPHLTARQVVEEALAVAGRICIYTNEQTVVEEL
jgi:ATP-dependent HslUV protease subunit HslV